MDKCKIFKIIQFGFICSSVVYGQVFAENDNTIEEDDEEEGELEPMNELPDIQTICPDLDRALDLSISRYKVPIEKIDDSFFKNLNFAIEMCSLGKGLWFLVDKRQAKNRSYEFDFHGRIETVWKHNLYIGGDVGFSSGKDCVWEGSNDNQKNNSEKLDTKYAHNFRGIYLNAMLGYNYNFDNRNDVIFAGKFGYGWTTVEKLKDQTCTNGDKYLFQPYWIGALISVETQPFDNPIFCGIDFQLNFILNKKNIDNLKNYFIPDYGHSSYKVNFGFNLFLGLKCNFEDKIITP